MVFAFDVELPGQSLERVCKTMNRFLELVGSDHLPAQVHVRGMIERFRVDLQALKLFKGREGMRWL